MIIGSRTKKKEDLILDCDGVLLDIVASYIIWFSLNFPTALKTEYFIKEPLIPYINSKDFDNILPVKYSKDAVSYLKNNYNLIVATSIGNEKNVREGRIRNLENIFGKNTFDEIYTLPFKSSKKEFYQALKKETIVIDDDYKNIYDASQEGLLPFKHKYLDVEKFFGPIPKEYKNFQSLKWKQIIERIRDLER